MSLKGFYAEFNFHREVVRELNQTMECSSEALRRDSIMSRGELSD